MHEGQKNFKAPPSKYQPKGLTILYEDRDILVVDKVSGLLTVGTDTDKENTAYYRLTDYVRKGVQKSKTRIFIVHRLDRDTSGVLVFAKNEKAKEYLQEQWPAFKKKYFAVVHGTLPEKEGVITSYLAENSIHKMYSVTDPKRGKLAQTGYKVLKESKLYTLLEIDLLTGRKNQIRVHFAEKGCPVAGDKTYGIKGKGIKRLTLHAFSLTLRHPHSKEEMTFEAKVPGYFYALLNRE
ncbi:MAG: RluA family pseudouridine synthase [Proteobacteria bacterium]|nr:RluA family pseudouridine synthase [Pseudomonadota bacterium]MBU1639249.1 RluA family pseudouridine synthase [Pseudomonadota bacterium]